MLKLKDLVPGTISKYHPAKAFKSVNEGPADDDMKAAEAMKDSAMRLKPEAGRDFIPAPEVEEDNFLTMQP